MDWLGGRPSTRLGKLEKLVVYFEKAPGAAQAQENITSGNKEFSLSFNNVHSPVLSCIFSITTMQV